MEINEFVQEINITEIEGLRIGNAQDDEAETGVTVLLFEQGAKAGVDVSGGGPASRETRLLEPLTADNPINAIVLSGGSAFGLAAADGVVRYLEERGIGYDTGFASPVSMILVSDVLTYGRMRIWAMPPVRMHKGTSRIAAASGRAAVRQ